MRNPKKLRLKIYPRLNSSDKVAPFTPNLLRVASVQGSENATIDPPLKTKTHEPKKPTEEKPQTVSQFQVFRHANLFEIFLICIGIVSATAGGCLLPPCIYIFAVMINTISNDVLESAKNSTIGATASNNTVIIDAVRVFAIQNALVGLGQLVFTYIAVMLFNYTSQRQAFRVRQLYLKSVLYQDISWYDNDMKSGNVATELTEDVIKFEEGIGEKIPEFIDHIAIFVSCIIFSFFYGWKLTIITLATIPLTVIVVAIVAWVISALSRKELDAFGAASSVAEEVFSAIKTVFAFGGQQSEVERYKKNLLVSYKLNMKMGLASGCGFGFLWLGIYASCGLLLWFGVTLILEQRDLPVEEREYDASVLFSTFFCVMSAAMHIGAISPYIEAFSVSKAAASKIFAVIDKISMINSQDTNGVKLAAFQNSIEFKNVDFEYPSRPGVRVLKKLNLRIKKGETVALVGHSGCGKSTCIQLLQRFYDPLNGQILFDGHDLRELNIAWLRNNVGIVGQEPVLFDTTIAENIRYGNLDATMEMVVEAAKKSNAHDFIMKLPSKYDTLVGERGAQISGGQKQRIAIARALVGDPAILLLDEATSALDNQSESKVQAALDKAHQGRTCIIIAHKLTTIRDASKIIVLSEGQVVEEGKHKELMELKGCYYAMVVAQDSQISQSPGNQVATNTREDEIDEDLEPITIKSEESDEETESKKTSKEVGMWKILKLNKPEWKPLAIAAIMSIVVGCSMPLFSILFGDMLTIVSNPDEDIMRNESIKYSFYFLAFGVIIGIATFIQIFLLTIASESLTTRLRGFAFQAMIKQEMAWFDEPSNGVGALCAKLSTEAAAVKGATGQRIGTVIQSVSCLGLAIGLSLYYEWRLGLVGMTFMPVMYIITVMHDRVYKKETLNYYKCLEKSTKIALEAVSNIRTVAGLGREEVFYKNYVKAVIPAFELAKKNTHYRGLVCGLFKSTGFLAYTAVMYYGGVLTQNKDMEFASVLKTGEALVMGVIIVGETIIFAPNFRKGVIAAGKIIELLERVPKLQDPMEPKQICEKDQADVSFNRVSFAYPTRPDVTVLNSLNLEVQSGKTIALIGSSGSGKSTVVKLLERFYDPLSGTINFINGTNIASVTQSSLRMSFGLVEQEPMIFARTIRENIAYGDTTRDVPMEEIIAAARKANIHNFVTSLPLGYETDLGNKGTMLSGGQKQRVAIARALVRSPKILLLDEATSALDTESEKIVQAALNEAKTGRTCILVAHRLSTIRDADMICVFSQGSIVEFGSHDDLVRNGGLYYEMLCLQNGKKP